MHVGATHVPLALRARPKDVVDAVHALAPLAGVPDGDDRWGHHVALSRRPAAQELDLLLDHLLRATVQVSRRATGPTHVFRAGPAPPSLRLADLLAAAEVLAEVIHGLGRELAWHPGGQADGSGWVGAAVTEVLVRGWDVATAIGITLTLPVEVCARTVRRAFPAVRAGSTPADRVLLALTGRVPDPAITGELLWHCHVRPLHVTQG